MEGYWKIPTYLDNRYTQFYKYLYVVYLSSETLNKVSNNRYTYIRPSGGLSTTQAYISSNLSCNCAGFPKDDGYAQTNGVSITSQVAGFTFIKARITGLVNSNAASIYNSIKDKFNLCNFFDDNVNKVYLKNGGIIELQSSGNGIYNFKMYRTGGTSATGVRFFKGSVQDYYSSGWMGLERPVTLNYSEALAAAMGGSPYNATFGAYNILYCTNPNGILTKYAQDTVSFFGHVYYAATADRFGILPVNTSSVGVNIETNENCAYALLGANGMTTSAGGEYVKATEDDENTYPGGGEDKNNYPDEGSDEPGGESGKGDFDNTNDQVDFPTLPTFDVQSTGFISLWRPTITQLTDLYTFLWDSDIGTTLKKLFNEPMNAIFSLGIIPVDPVTQGTRRLTIGHVDTEIDMESIQKQFVTFDFGSIDINEYYGAAWDYSPYTHASIYLPYIGVQPVDIDDIMNCTLTLRYNIDVLTGTTIALLKCARKGRDNLNAVMYEWQGNCVTQCPITAGNWSQIMASVIQLGAMTGLALSQPVVGAIGSAVGSSAAAEYAQGKNLVNPTMATYGALNVLGSKVHVQRGGRLDMSSGAMSMQKAFVILNRPVSGIPRGWNKYAGYPSLKIKTLGSQEGFISVGAIKLDGLRATAEEINELDTILKTGVII